MTEVKQKNIQEIYFTVNITLLSYPYIALFINLKVPLTLYVIALN